MTNLVDLITPTNLDSERDKFFASNTYKPIFSYSWREIDTDPVFAGDAKNKLWQAIKIQNHDQIVTAASQLFEVKINQSTLDQALAISGQEGERSESSLDLIIDEFKDAFKYFELDYKIKIVDDGGFNIRPRHEDRELLISKHIHFEYFSSLAEVHHELVHIIRSVNGQYNQIKQSEYYLSTEEGLASWCQDHTNDDLSQVQHAMEYIASAVGVDGGLRDIYDCFLSMGTSKELAWKRASRHKFGFIHTYLPGDILKPAMYFDNSQKIDKLTQGEKLRLFVGKINLRALSDFPTYTGLWPDEQIIDYFRLE